MIRTFIFACLPFFFFGCSGTLSQDPEVKGYEKVFEHEDQYILLALRAEQVQVNKQAAELFEILYEKSTKKEYLYRSLQNYLVAKENAYVLKKVYSILQASFDDFQLVRFKIVALVGMQRIEEAKEIALKLVSLSHEESDYILISDIYVEQKKFSMAMKYLEGAYTKNYSEKVLDKMSIVLYFNLQRKKEAIAQLETHIRMHSCSELICSRLISFYSNENNVDGLLSTYLRLYALAKDEEVAKKIIQIYVYKKEYLDLISFLEKYPVDDPLLLQIYTRYKNYTKASPLAQKLYEESSDVGYLAQSAIFEYEGSKNKNDKIMLAKVLKKLKEAVELEESSLNLNYLGYIMVDHEIDIKEGMNYIQKALKIEPNSAYYLDSLAWGYYKLGKCDKAYSIISKVIELEGGDDPEVKLHYEKIKKCKNSKKGTKKK
jgi:predicted Zn-dependent protease